MPNASVAPNVGYQRRDLNLLGAPTVQIHRVLRIRRDTAGVQSRPILRSSALSYALSGRRVFEPSLITTGSVESHRILEYYTRFYATFARPVSTTWRRSASPQAGISETERAHEAASRLLRASRWSTNVDLVLLLSGVRTCGQALMLWAVVVGGFVDNLVRRAQRHTAASTRGWLVGGPPEEVALLNRLTERLVRNRLCLVSGTPGGTVDTSYRTLHRRGGGGTDLYGADLAVSVHVRRTSFLKTAMFQLKRAKKGLVKVETRQLAEMSVAYPFVGYSPFLMAAGQDDGAIRIRSVDDLLTIMKPSTALPWPRGASFRVSDPGWLPPNTWTKQWLSCDVGARSPINAPSAVEALLWRHVEAPEEAPTWVAQEISSDLGALVAELPEGWVPTRSWIVFEISHEAWEEEFAGGSGKDRAPSGTPIDPAILEDLRRLW